MFLSLVKRLARVIFGYLRFFVLFVALFWFVLLHFVCVSVSMIDGLRRLVSVSVSPWRLCSNFCLVWRAQA